MLDNKIVSQATLARNGHTQAFEVAFVPQIENKIRTELLNRVSADTSTAIGVLIDFRSALHRWAANPDITPAEFEAEIEKVKDAGLLPFVNYLCCNLGNFHKVVIGGEK